MRRARRSSSLVLLVSITLLLCAPQIAFASWQEDYEEGKQAYEDDEEP